MEINFHPVFEFAKDHTPILAKKLMPEWIKNLPPIVPGIDDRDIKTIKKCPPTIDFLTSGYYMLSPGNYHFKREINNGEEDIFINGDEYINAIENGKNISMPTLGFHIHDQAPIIINGIKKSIWKIYQFWAIETPPGYSCMFLSPTYFYQPFQIFPAIVDTDDGFKVPQSLPMMCSFDDNETHEWSIKKGDPLALVIPFKRDEWHTTINDVCQENQEIALNRNYQSYDINFHKKKIFK
jgi:hypothetical protein